MNNKFKKVLIIAPHPDDETLALGGTIKRMIKANIEVSILVVSAHMPPLYSLKEHKITISESKRVFKYFGIKKFKFLNIPATKINEILNWDIEDNIEDIINETINIYTAKLKC